ncbi:MAG: hypothetical protein M3Y93_13765, partial [Pseudomonadota bacterium]|nr:hypothetical protein [Pseudomonadota bacterium]
MNQEFDHARNVYVDRDADGVGRQLSHTHAPVVIEGATARQVVATYLRRFGDLLGLTSDQLENLDSPPSKTLEDAGVEYRFLDEKLQFDIVTIAYNQTEFGLPVWRAGIGVYVKLNPFKVVGAQSTMHPDLQVKRPSMDAVKRAESLTEKELASKLGLRIDDPDGHGWDGDSLKIEGRSLVIYRYESAKRAPPGPQRMSQAEPVEPAHNHASASGVPTLPLPPVAEPIRDGHHYVCAKIDFALSGRVFRILHWTAIVDVASLSVLYLVPYTSGVKGMVFEIDPITTNGGPAPSGTNTTLNPIRVSAVLPGMVPPVAGIQSLVGDNVQLSDVESPTIAAPTEPTGTDFNFDARTDNFAAVNAYYHCDKFFRLLDGMGFSQASYFGSTTFPT